MIMFSKIKRLALTPLIIIGALSLAACSEQQQDSFYQSAVKLDRKISGLTLKSQEISDGTLFYTEGGSDSNGETILLVHGFSADKDHWTRFAKNLVDDYRVIAVDLAGHGDSSSEPSLSFEFPDQVKRLREFTQKLGIERFHIAGNSMGGAMSILYANMYPEQIISVGLFCSAGITSPSPSLYKKALHEGKNLLIPTTADGVDYLLDLVMEDQPFIPWPITNAITRKTIARAPLNKKIFSDIYKAKTILTDGTAEVLLNNIQQPTLILWGKEDRILDVSAAGEFKKNLINSQVIVMDGIGHLPMLEAPNESADHYLEFLKSI